MSPLSYRYGVIVAGYWVLTVASAVVAWKLAEVGGLKALSVTVHCTHDTGPRLLENLFKATGFANGKDQPVHAAAEFMWLQSIWEICADEGFNIATTYRFHLPDNLHLRPQSQYRHLVIKLVRCRKKEESAIKIKHDMQYRGWVKNFSGHTHLWKCNEKQ